MYLRLNCLFKSIQIDSLCNNDIFLNFSENNVLVITELRPKHESVLFYVQFYQSETQEELIYLRAMDFRPHWCWKYGISFFLFK